MAVVADSAATLPPRLAEDERLHVVPMRLTIAGQTYLDGEDLSPTSFYKRLRDLQEIPVTSGPSPAAFLTAYRNAAESASAVLCTTVSPRFSSSHDAARTAALEAAKELPETEIVVLDTESAAGGEGLVSLSALRSAARGEGLAEARAAAMVVVQRVSLVAYLDTLYYVWKGGRVPGLAYAGTSLLKIKPMFELRRGAIRTVARPRTVRRAIDRLLELVRRGAGSGRLNAAVMHGDAPETAELVRRRIESEFECGELYVGEFSPVMGVHTGPGLVGVAFWSEQDGP